MSLDNANKASKRDPYLISTYVALDLLAFGYSLYAAIQLNNTHPIASVAASMITTFTNIDALINIANPNSDSSTPLMWGAKKLFNTFFKQETSAPEKKSVESEAANLANSTVKPVAASI